MRSYIEDEPGDAFVVKVLGSISNLRNLAFRRGPLTLWITGGKLSVCFSFSSTMLRADGCKFIHCRRGGRSRLRHLCEWARAGPERGCSGAAGGVVECGAAAAVFLRGRELDVPAAGPGSGRPGVGSQPAGTAMVQPGRRTCERARADSLSCGYAGGVWVGD